MKFHPHFLECYSAVVKDKARIMGNAWIMGEALVSGNAEISGTATISDSVVVTGFSSVSGAVDLRDNVHLQGSAYCLAAESYFVNDPRPKGLSDFDWGHDDNSLEYLEDFDRHMFKVKRPNRLKISGSVSLSGGDTVGSGYILREPLDLDDSNVLKYVGEDIGHACNLLRKDLVE